MQLVQGDATRLPIRPAAMDVVIVAFGLRNVERLDVALDEIGRTLVDGGTLAILEFAVPERGLVRAIYLWYFTRVLPRIGRVVSGHASAYAYLPASVHTFPPPREFRTLLDCHGFSTIVSDPLTGGIVYLHVATKRSASSAGTHTAERLTVDGVL
jgi:demethylmenaquinone methyltransferase/2-methoxy-6-polyprenyl-1,4-benzoquinol methylase